MNATTVSSNVRRDASPIDAWARSGLMALSGPANGPPAMLSFDAISRIDQLLNSFSASAAAFGPSRRYDMRLLTERAALGGFARGGFASCNRSCRLIEARDGWIAVNLPRDRDVEAVPAWIGGATGLDPWPAIARAARSMDKAELVAAAQLLSLAVSDVGQPPGTSDHVGDIVRTHRIGSGRSHSRERLRHPPLVIDLSALWAGPLCTQLLAHAGARVIKVESTTRPDSIRGASRRFFDLLNAGKESVALDFTQSADRQRLTAMIAGADVVVTSARRRAFEQMGLQPEYPGSLNPGLTWVAITAHGWSGENGNRVGFGDDAAAAGGFVAHARDGRPMFAGDAIADPLTGIAAATAALDSLSSGGGVLVDVSLRDTARFVAGADPIDPGHHTTIVRERGEWFVRVDGASTRVTQPRTRAAKGRAARFGADTQRVLAEFCQSQQPKPSRSQQ